MNDIVYKTNFEEISSTFLEYQVENAVILVNAKNATWTTLSTDEYDLYSELKIKKNLEDSRVDSFILKLIVNGLIYFRINTPKTIITEPQISVYFAPTHFCNLRCVYCYAMAEPPLKKNSSEYSATIDTFRILDNILTENVETVYFTGGEPTLTKDFYSLSDYVQSKGVKVGILTNGTTINKENVEKFKYFDRVSISLDGSTAEINDITRGAGSFNKIVSGIKLLRQNGVDVTVASVISKSNIENVTELFQFVNETLGVSSHKVSLYVSHGRGKENADSMECSYEEIISFRSKYIQHQIDSRSKGNVVSLLQPRLEKGMIKNICGVATKETFIDDKGDVYPCRLFEDEKYKLGNIIETPLSNILENKKTKQFKDRLCVDSIPSCKSCDIKNLCGGGCRSSHACYTGDVSISHEKFCKIMRNDIKSAILLESGFNPVTLQKIRG